MTNLGQRIQTDVRKALRGLVDPNIILGNFTGCETEVGRRALEIGYKFELTPERITFEEIEGVVRHDDSEIGNHGDYLTHIFNTGGVFEGFVAALLKIHPDLDVPDPIIARAMGYIHDWNAVFSNYDRGGQQTKELDLFFVARALGWDHIENEVALHSDYIGIARLMAEGVIKFPKQQEAYVGMTEVLQDEDSPVSYEAIARQFADLLEGRGNAPGMALTIADYMAPEKRYHGSAEFSEASLIKGFQDRSDSILKRYHGDAVEKGDAPSPLGQALFAGGMDRIRGYRDTFATLLRNDPREMEVLHEEKRGLFLE